MATETGPPLYTKAGILGAYQSEPRPETVRAAEELARRLGVKYDTSRFGVSKPKLMDEAKAKALAFRAILNKISDRTADRLKKDALELFDADHPHLFEAELWASMRLQTTHLRHVVDVVRGLPMRREFWEGVATSAMELAGPPPADAASGSDYDAFCDTLKERKLRSNGLIGLALLGFIRVTDIVQMSVRLISDSPSQEDAMSHIDTLTGLHRHRLLTRGHGKLVSGVLQDLKPMLKFKLMDLVDQLS